MDASERSQTSGQTIRVFVSSTFRDMHAERDVLNRVVFPELRRRCQARRAEFVGLDLRWGVTEDEIQRDGTLAICLQEIAQCRPFFVCLLGERFGSVYPPDEVPVSFWGAVPRESALRPLVEQWYHRDDTIRPPVYRLRRKRGRALREDEATALVRYWEVQGLPGAGDSLTAHEIFRGVLEAAEPPAHALCYVRTPGLTEDRTFPSSFVSFFVETDEARRQKLAALRTRVRGAGDRLTVCEYDARYAGLTIDASLLPPDLPPTDRAALQDGVVTPKEWPAVSPRLREAIERHGTVALTGMEAFAVRVADDLWRVIEPQLARPVVLDAHQRERAHHEQFVSRHTAHFQGRGSERERVRKYLENRGNREILVITGEPGAGKSAFLAACLQDARTRHAEALVIPHFIGAAPESASLSATLRSLCETLRREATLDEAVAQDLDKLRVQLRTFLEQAGTRRPLILVIDALNQLDPSNRSHDLDWLPLSAPPGTRIVVSTLSGDCLEHLTRRVPADHVLTIPPLPEDERRSLIGAVLARRRKQLTLDQLNALLDTSARPDAALPLYTLVALEELCLFGEYGALDVRLASLPPTIPELFAQVLARLEHDHTRRTLEAVCSWLAVARAGLLEAEVLDLLSINGPFPRLRWTRLYRALEPYLKPIEEEPDGNATGRLDFYHDQLRLAVFRRYLQMQAPDVAPTDAFRSAHRQLAEYLRSVAYDETFPTKWRTERVRSLSELPFHQTRGELWDDLYQTLTDLDFLEAKCTGVAVGTQGSGENVRRIYRGVYGLQEDFRRALESAPTQDRIREHEQIEALARVIDRRSHVLSRDPTRMLQEAYNALVWDWADETLLGRNLRRTTSAWPWLRRVNPPLKPLNKGHSAVIRTMSHGTEVNTLAFAPDRSLLASGGKEGMVRLWDAQTGAPLHTLVGHTGAVTSVAFADGTRLASSAWDGTVRLWDVRAGVLLRTWNVWTFGDRPVTSVAFAPDGTRLASGSWDGSAQLLDVQSGAIVRMPTDHSGPVLSVAFTSDGTKLASGSLRGAVRLWDAWTGALIQTLNLEPWPELGSLAFSPDGTRLAVGRGDGTVELRDARTGEQLQTLIDDVNNVTSVVFAPDGMRLATGSWDGTVRLWDARAGLLLRTWNVGLTFDHRPVTSVAFAPDGTQLASGSRDGTVRVWDAETDGFWQMSTPARSFNQTTRIRLCVGRWLRACARRLHLTLEDRTKDALRILADYGRRVASLAFAPDGSRFAIGGEDGTVQLWAMRTSKLPRKLTRHADRVTAIAFGSDGSRLASASDDGMVQVWDARTGAALHALTGAPWVTSVAFSADGTRLVSVSVGMMQQWDGKTGILLQEDHESFGVTSVAFALDGTKLAKGGWDGTVQLWSASTGELLSTLTGHALPVLSLAFSADGRRLASGGEDGTVRLWDLASRELLAWVECEDAVRAVAFEPKANGAESRLWILDTRGTTHDPEVWILEIVSGPEATFAHQN